MKSYHISYGALPALQQLIQKGYSEHIGNNTGSQQDLWAFGISGDLPVILAVLESKDEDILEWILRGA